MTAFDRPVARYMTSPVVTVPEGADLAQAMGRMQDHGVSCLAVTGAGGRLAGVISRTDLLRVGRLRATMAEDPRLLNIPRLAVRNRMARGAVGLPPSTPVRVAAAWLVERRIHRVFVVDHDRPVGVVATREVMRAVTDAGVATPIRALMSSPVVAVEAADALAAVTDRLAAARVHSLVVTEAGWPVGLFTQTEALAARALPAHTAVAEAMSVALLCLPETTPAHRAAALAVCTRARRVLAVEARALVGILTGLDLARLAAGGAALAARPEAR